MSTLRIPDEGRELRDWNQIASFLHERGVRFERWTASAPLAADASADDVLKAYAGDIERLQRDEGYKACDVISVNAETPNLEQVRVKFMPEHTHSEDEVRYFVEGSGIFWFHLASSPVFAVHCEKGDFLSVPANTPHWFDFGPTVHVKCIRLFNDSAGWVANYTGSGIDEKYNPVYGGDGDRIGVTVRALLFDVEGTITSLSFVKDELYPYAWRVLPDFLRQHARQPDVARIVERLAHELGTEETGSISQVLRAWIDEDRKHPDLKELQGIIWCEGYQAGAFRGHLYGDVLPFWRVAKGRGLVLAIYSSGSAQAQRLLLQHSIFGDVAYLVDHHFDTAVGPKTSVEAYERIATEMAVEAGSIRFFSDSVAELDAAGSAGFQTCRTLRPGVSHVHQGHDEIRDFADVNMLLHT